MGLNINGTSDTLHVNMTFNNYLYTKNTGINPNKRGCLKNKDLISLKNSI